MSTATAPTPTAAESTAKQGADVPERVDAHMWKHFSGDDAPAGWIVACDYRDNTAVVVHRQTNDLLTMPAARGMSLYKWLCSLRDAGFTAEARTDMEVFGRPDEQSSDGLAHWLHITGWSEPQVRPGRTISELAQELRDKLGQLPEHNVVLNPGSVPELSGQPVHGFRFSTFKDALQVTVIFDETAEPLPDPPGWVLDLARQHDGHGEQWCRPRGLAS